MASISSTPDALNPVEKGVKWVGTQAPTADPIETRFGYKVQVNGSDIYNVERSVLPPSGSAPIVLDVKEDVHGLISTEIPSPAIIGVGSDSSILADVSLVYGTITIDKSTDPPTVTKNVGTTSGPFKVMNSSVNVFDESDITSITPTILSWIPDEITMFPDTRAWVWVLGGAGITFNWKYRDGSVGSTSGSAAFDVSYVPLAPKNIGIPNPEQLVWIDVQIGALKTIRVWIECVTPKIDTGAIMFLEPIGGRSTIAFQEISGLGFNSSYQLIKKHIDPAISFGDYQNLAGYSISGKSGGASRSFTKTMRVTDQVMHYMEGFFGSSEYHLQHVDTGGNTVWNKFILTGGAFSIDSASGVGQLTCSGYLANQTISQRSVI